MAETWYSVMDYLLVKKFFYTSILPKVARFQRRHNQDAIELR